VGIAHSYLCHLEALSPVALVLPAWWRSRAAASAAPLPFTPVLEGMVVRTTVHLPGLPPPTGDRTHSVSPRGKPRLRGVLANGHCELSGPRREVGMEPFPPALPLSP